MLIDELRPIVHWVSHHPYVGLGFAFVISFLESLAIVGIIVPGSVFMTAIGTLVGSGILPFWATLIWAAFGAIVGDVLSFWLGYHFHDRIRTIWPVSRYPVLLEKGQAFFERHGKKSIFLGRFAGPMRPVIPMLGGMMDMRVKPFLITDFISAFLWAPTYMLPGILLGAASLALPPEIATRLILIVILAIFLIWFFSWLIKRIYLWLCQLCSLMNRFFWRAMMATANGKRFTIWLHPQDPEDHAQLNRALYCLLLILFIIFIVWDVKHFGMLDNLNHSVYYLMQSFRSDLLDKIAVYLTILGDKKIIIPTFFIIFAYLIGKKHYRFAFHWLGLIIVTAATIFILKELVAIPRPGDLTPELNYSFPSGHATLSIIFYGFMASFICDRTKKSLHRFIYIITTLIILIVCLSRLYLGAHWLTDIIGGLLLGSIMFELTSLSLHRYQTNTPSLKYFTLITLGLFVILAGTYNIVFYKSLMKPFTRSWQITNVSMQAWWNEHDTVPIVRSNRLGQPTQLMNIEWFDNLNNIKQLLVNHNWQLAPERSFTTTLHRIAAQHGTHQLPILEVLYDNTAPLLVLTHPGVKGSKPIVLRLWQSHFTVEHKTLYIGTVYFQEVHQGISFFHKHNYSNKPTNPALNELFVFLSHQDTKIINTTSNRRPIIIGPILLIRHR